MWRSRRTRPDVVAPVGGDDERPAAGHAGASSRHGQGIELQRHSQPARRSHRPGGFWATEITLQTGTDGTYAHWFDERNNPLTMIVAKDGWKPRTRQTQITAGGTTVENFALNKVRC